MRGTVVCKYLSHTLPLQNLKDRHTQIGFYPKLDVIAAVFRDLLKKSIQTFSHPLHRNPVFASLVVLLED
jgi:hypothetical protein